MTIAEGRTCKTRHRQRSSLYRRSGLYLVWYFMDYASSGQLRFAVHLEPDDVYFEFFAVVESLEYVVVSLREWVSQVVATGYQQDSYRSHFSSSVRRPLTRYFFALVPSSTARPVLSCMATVSQLQLGVGASRIA